MLMLVGPLRTRPEPLEPLGHVPADHVEIFCPKCKRVQLLRRRPSIPARAVRGIKTCPKCPLPVLWLDEAGNEIRPEGPR